MHLLCIPVLVCFSFFFCFCSNHATLRMSFVSFLHFMNFVLYLQINETSLNFCFMLFGFLEFLLHYYTIFFWLPTITLLSFLFLILMVVYVWLKHFHPRFPLTCERIENSTNKYIYNNGNSVFSVQSHTFPHQCQGENRNWR